MKSHPSPLALLVILDLDMRLCAGPVHRRGAGLRPRHDGRHPHGRCRVACRRRRSPLWFDGARWAGHEPWRLRILAGLGLRRTAACPGTGSAAGQSPAPMFDGGGIGTSGMGSCAASGITPPAGSSFTAAGTGAPPPSGTGIPLGSVEMAPAGLSPPPPVVSIAPSSLPPVTGSTLPCPGGTMSMDGTMPMGGTTPMASGSC